MDEEARERHAGRGFANLADHEKDRLLRLMQRGEVSGGHWYRLDARTFFKHRVIADIPMLYYSHPKAWNEIGFGGPASPRGYVRLDGDLLDPWEAIEADPEQNHIVRQENQHVF